MYEYGTKYASISVRVCLYKLDMTTLKYYCYVMNESKKNFVMSFKGCTRTYHIPTLHIHIMVKQNLPAI